jgi:hypothetical protein
MMKFIARLTFSLFFFVAAMALLPRAFRVMECSSWTWSSFRNCVEKQK